MTKYLCSSLPECQWLWSQASIRKDLRTSNKDELALRMRARELVVLHVLGRIPYRGGGSEFLASLLRKGYARDDVVLALADAWLSESDHFELPRRSRMAWLHTLWGRFLLSVLVTLGLIGMGMKLMARVIPEVDLYLLAIPPLLSIVSLLVLIVVFLVINRLHHWWSTKSSGASQ